MELRDERVVFFVTWLQQGTHEISYRMRAEAPGKLNAMPCRAVAMYAPRLSGIPVAEHCVWNLPISNWCLLTTSASCRSRISSLGASARSRSISAVGMGLFCARWRRTSQGTTSSVSSA